MNPPPVKQPVFWIVAGPNGSGKSSLHERSNIAAFGRSIWIINPDLLALRISQAERLELLEANREAVIRIETWLEASLRAHQTIGVETVLSTPKYRRLVSLAKGLSITVNLIYVMLDDPERNVERVRLRVEKGGHTVPEDKIRERYHKSLQQLPWFLEQADEAALFDNSDGSPKRVGHKKDGVVTLDPKAPGHLRSALGLPHI